MKCIKDKCKYCQEHDYRLSYYNCSLTNRSFKKDSNISCLMQDVIQDMEDNLIGLKEYYNTIKNLEL